MPRRNRRRHVYSDNRMRTYMNSKVNSCSIGEDVHSDAHTEISADQETTTEEKAAEQENRSKQTVVLVRKYTKRLSNHRKPGQGRRKAHSSNKRKDRAISTISKMLKSAERAQKHLSMSSRQE